MNLLPTEGGEGGGGRGGGKEEKGWKRVKSNEHPVSQKAPALIVKYLNSRPGHSIE